ncbi:MAG TPA: ERF family protein, partial [Candidatus Limnocylindrales bacterium]|nr:ERF family protein [Candidatus Limnocylindrales bacterium]
MPRRAAPTTTAEADGEQTETPEEAARRIFDSDLTKRPVIAKLARIMADLPELKPEGRNEHFKYSFIKDTQISGAVRPRMAREHLMVIPEVLEESWVETKTRNGGTSWVTKLKVQFTIIDADSGDYVIGVGFGYGDDSGDKGANKAFTAAMKYFLIKLFQIGGEDLE